MQVQLEVVIRRGETIWTGPIKRGDTVWVNEGAARKLLEDGICRFLVDAPKPEQTNEVSEQTEVIAPKSAAVPMAGLSTDSQSSNASGPETLSSASAAALVLPQRL